MTLYLRQTFIYLLFIVSYSVLSGQTYLGGISIGNTGNERPYELVTSPAGDIYVSGFFNGTVDFDPSVNVSNLVSNGGSGDVFLAKYNTGNSLEWAISFGGSGYDASHSLDLDSDGNIYLTGRFEGTVDFDLSVSTFNLSSLGGIDIFVAKYKPDGSFSWAINLGGSANEEGLALKVFQNSSFYLSGKFQGIADFDPTVAAANLTSAGADDIFIANYGLDGSFMWVHQIGGISSDVSSDLVLGASSQVFLTGSFSSTADFDPSASTANLSSTGNADIFVASYDKNGNYAWAHNFGGTGFFGNEGT